MAVGKNKAITIWPGWVARVMAKMLAPENFGDFGHPKWHARVPGIGLLNGIHGQGADGACKLVEGRRDGSWAGGTGGGIGGRQ